MECPNLACTNKISHVNISRVKAHDGKTRHDAVLFTCPDCRTVISCSFDTQRIVSLYALEIYRQVFELQKSLAAAKRAIDDVRRRSSVRKGRRPSAA